MKLQQAYCVGFERKSFTAYGIKLHPLTLGHVQLMAMMGSEIPWQCPSGVKMVDVCSAVAVGMFPAWEDAKHHFEVDDEIHQILADKMARNNNEDQAKIALDWLAYYLDKPRALGSYDIMDSRCPWWWTYAEFLQTEIGKTEEQAWGTICADAFSYYAAFASRTGSNQFLTIREVVLEDAVKNGKTMAQLFDEGVL